MKWVATLAVVAACSGHQRVGSEPSWRHPGSGSGSASQVVVPQTFAPTTDAARNYNEPLQPAPRTPLGDAVAAAVKAAADRAHLPAPVGDAALFRACDAIATVVPEEGELDSNVEHWFLQRYGVIDPTPIVYTSWAEDEQVDHVLDGMRVALDAIVAARAKRFGIGFAKRRSDGTVAVVLIGDVSSVKTAPIPRWVAANATFDINGTFESPIRDPELWAGYDDGTVEKIAMEVRPGAFLAHVSCGGRRGREQIEIEAVGDRGPLTLANFPVWCGSQPPDQIPPPFPTEDISTMTTNAAERRLFTLVNRDRQAAGLPALLWDEHVAAVARAHSDEMQRTMIVAHVSPITGTGSAMDRLRVAGIKTGVALENVARADSVSSAHAGLMNSPSHKANLFSRSATHIGIGIAFDERGPKRELYATEVVIRIPPKADPARVAAVLAQRISSIRPVSLHEDLAKIAQRYAEGLAAGRENEVVHASLKKELDALAGSLNSVSTVVISGVADADVVGGKDVLGDLKPDFMGVGVAQGPSPEIGEGAIWIVVLFAERPKK